MTFIIRAFNTETHIASVEFDGVLVDVKIPKGNGDNYLIGAELNRYVEGFRPQYHTPVQADNGVANLNSILSLVTPVTATP